LNHVIARLGAIFASLGGFGLLILGILDSSFLFLPLGNDLLLVAMTARHHEKMAYYAAMATLGSVAGCFLTDMVSRKGGEEGLKNHVSRKRLTYVKKKVKQHAGPALALAAIMPPPFPFTLFVIVAAALQYPRAKLLGIIGATRLVRFLAEGALAIVFGRKILAMAELPVVQGFIIAIVVISIGGSVWSIFKWVRTSRTRR
jgi:membrane protein YqaA with SNARE-associated domain